MIKPECPMCRSTNVTFTKETFEAIVKNSKKYREEREEEDRQDIIQSLPRSVIDEPTRMIATITMALSFLLDSFPLGCIPLEFVIRGSPPIITRGERRIRRPYTIFELESMSHQLIYDFWSKISREVSLSENET
ncbi:MAG TPA: hypothetical protein VFM18_21535, partial [Methanosarcina sp.]|nr:hypothetical protein [Methanosarcina sp.]